MVHANAGAGGKPAETDFFRRPPAFLNFPRIFSVALHCVRTLLFVSALLQQQVMLPACKSPGSSWWYRSRPPCPDIFTAGLQTAASRILPYSAEISRPHRRILNLPFPLYPPPILFGKVGQQQTLLQPSGAAGCEHPSTARGLGGCSTKYPREINPAAPAPAPAARFARGRSATWRGRGAQSKVWGAKMCRGRGGGRLLWKRRGREAVC